MRLSLQQRANSQTYRRCFHLPRCLMAIISMISLVKRPDLEPVVLLGGIITLGNLGTILHKSSRGYLFQQAQCFNYYQIHDATAIGSNHLIEEFLCKTPIIQSKFSIVEGVDSFLQCLPRKPFHQSHGSQTIFMVMSMTWRTNTTSLIALLVLGMYRELMERIGLRRVVILNLCCAAMAVLYSVVSCESPQHETVLPIFYHSIAHSCA